VKRRAFAIGLVAVLAAPRGAGAQQAARVPKIGVLYMNTPVSTTGLPDAFWKRLRELGWVNGRNVAVELRGAAGERKQLLILAAELMDLKVDVIVMDNGTAAKRVEESTRPTPICVVGGDLQAAGVVKNLAKPEGHITGVQLFQPDLVGKRAGLLKETVRGLARVGLLTGARDAPISIAALRIAEEACRAAALELHIKEVLTAQDLEPAFAALERAGVRGLLVMNHAQLTVHRDKVVALVTKSRLPAIYEYSSWPAAGGLMSYGAISADFHRQLAECVDKVLRGVKPADLPVQQPTKFELVINLKTAKTLGVTIPPSLLLRADQVIE
jgi:putative tryptophan/tyrosine transport system substrate-binding protein